MPARDYQSAAEATSLLGSVASLAMRKKSTCFSIKNVRFAGNHSPLISITIFGRTFSDELPLLEIVSEFVEINYFKEQRH